MKRLVVLALALAGIIGVVPAAATALPPGVVPGPNSITGTVTDESGQGLSPVLVYDPTFSISTVTEADGTYLLEGVPTGTEGVVTADDLFNRFPSSESESVIVSGDGTVVADIVMHPFPTAGISGTIRDTAGGPLSGITVTESQQGRSTVTTADGAYAFDGLRIDQSVTIFASDPSGLHRSNFNDIFDIAADGSSVLDLVLIDNVPSVVGLVTDPAGNAVAGASVSIPDIGGFAQTDGTGRFAVGDATAAGTFTLSVDPTAVRPDLASADVPVTLVAGSSVTANVQLARGATIDLTVTAGGAPADATVALWSGLQFGGVVQRAEVGVDGTVTLPIRADGDYYVEVTSRTTEFASEFYPDSIFREDGQRFTFAGEQHVAITVELEQAATISGTITMPDGTPGDFTQVAATPVGHDDQIFGVPRCNLPSSDDPAGTYRIGCLHPSVDWVIKGFGQGVADHGYYVDSQSAFNATPISVEPGQTVTGIDLRLRPKSPDPTLTGLSQQYFLSGTTTPGVHVFGTNFPLDPHAIQLDTDVFFFGLNAFLTVTDVLSSNELVATVRVDAGDIGPLPMIKQLSMSTSIGSGADCSCNLFIGDPSTPVASVSGRVLDNRGRPAANIAVTVRRTTVDEFGSFGQRRAVTGPDGRWVAQGVSPGTYTVFFEGTETLNPQYWKQRNRLADATPITLKNGDTRRGIDATLTRRDPIKVFSATPKYQTTDLSFDLVGQGLSSIRGGFRVSINTPFGPFSLQSTSVSNSRLRVTGFAFQGTWDVVTEWTADDGTVKSTTCVKCITVYDGLSAFAFDNQVQPGTTATVTYFGSGLLDLTRVSVGGRDVSVVSYRGLEGGSGIEITFAVRRGAALGSRPVTITRADGATAITEVVVGTPA